MKYGNGLVLSYWTMQKALSTDFSFSISQNEIPTVNDVVCTVQTSKKVLSYDTQHFI